MCAIDFSKFTNPVLNHGINLAHRFNARLFVFHSVHCPQDPLYGTAEFEHGGELEKQIAHAFETITALMQPRAVPWKSLVLSGDPVKMVSKAAEQVAADLVIGASHGHSGWQRMFIGTVVERMARNLTRPFLVIRRPDRDALDESFHDVMPIRTHRGRM